MAVELYNASKFLKNVSDEYGLPKFTILIWVKKADSIAINKNEVITQADYEVLLKKIARVEGKNEILKKQWSYLHSI
ncbi:transposase [Sporanaerobacter acetigenes DSM 13106]|uniref:Transposase n=1 Tax=Sporanaerobacter acetigenes DSM 13106 TaxID=1123281 RepID=A0A1M5ZAS4_9FIRM|nr:transposase [Sporanaerobacter acetigenes DSM 13106]